VLLRSASTCIDGVSETEIRKMSKLLLNQLAATNMAYNRFSFDYFLESMQRLGVHNVEIYGCSTHLHPYDGGEPVPVIRRKIREAGLRVISMMPEQNVYPVNLAQIVQEAKETVCEMFEHTKHIEQLAAIIDLAVELSGNDEADAVNIRHIGQGWVAEEALAIAIYCSLRYEDNFSAGIIAAVNHDGDSDSTGAITGNILGAMVGYSGIEQKWKENLELADVILEVADDLCHGCQMSEYSPCKDPDWVRKYIYAQWNSQM